jgi:hypothetical protein
MSFRYFDTNLLIGNLPRPNVSAPESRDDLLAPPLYRERLAPHGRPERGNGWAPTPNLVGPEEEGGPEGIWYAEYAALERDDDEQTEHLRSQKQSQLDGYINAAKPLDDDQAGIDDDRRSRAMEQRVKINAVPAGDLPAMEALGTGEDDLPPLRNDYLGFIQARAYAGILDDDDKIIESGGDGLDPNDRVIVVESMATAINAREGIGAPTDPPIVVRDKVRLPGEATGHLIVEWASETSVGKHFRCELHRDDANAMSVVAYKNGTYWYAAGAFIATGVPGVWEIAPWLGGGIKSGDVLGLEVVAGSAPITGKKTLAFDADRVRFTIRWGGEHVGTVTIATGADSPRRSRR